MTQNPLNSISPTFALATQLTDAHGDDLEDLDRKWHDRWADEDEDWLVVLNGTNTPWTTQTTPESDEHFEHPFRVTVPPGCAFVMVDNEAIAVFHPSHTEFFTAPEATRAWENALLRGIHDRLLELGADLPELSELIEPEDIAVPTPN